jgi:uncharacterized protein YndB with AHSA1/START domain
MKTDAAAGEQERESEIMEIRKTILIDASPEVVFNAIIDPNEFTNWFPDQVILEPKVGGKVKFSFYKTDTEYRQIDYFPEGTVIEFIPNKRISYTYREPNITSFPNTVVTWELEKIESDKTRVKFSHTGFKPGEIIRKHDEGWSHFLIELTKYCQKGSRFPK